MYTRNTSKQVQCYPGETTEYENVCGFMTYLIQNNDFARFKEFAKIYYSKLYPNCYTEEILLSKVNAVILEGSMHFLQNQIPDQKEKEFALIRWALDDKKKIYVPPKEDSFHFKYEQYNNSFKSKIPSFTGIKTDNLYNINIKALTQWELPSKLIIYLSKTNYLSKRVKQLAKIGTSLFKVDPFYASSIYEAFSKRNDDIKAICSSNPIDKENYQHFIEVASQYNKNLAEQYKAFMKEDIQNFIDQLKSMNVALQLKALERLNADLRIKPGVGALLLKESMFFLDVLISESAPIELINGSSSYLLNAYTYGYFTKMEAVFNILNGQNNVNI